MVHLVPLSPILHLYSTGLFLGQNDTQWKMYQLELCCILRHLTIGYPYQYRYIGAANTPPLELADAQSQKDSNHCDLFIGKLVSQFGVSNVSLCLPYFPSAAIGSIVRIPFLVELKPTDVSCKRSARSANRWRSDVHLANRPQIPLSTRESGLMSSATSASSQPACPSSARSSRKPSPPPYAPNCQAAAHHDTEPGLSVFRMATKSPGQAHWERATSVLAYTVAKQRIIGRGMITACRRLRLRMKAVVRRVRRRWCRWGRLPLDMMSRGRNGIGILLLRFRL